MPSSFHIALASLCLASAFSAHPAAAADASGAGLALVQPWPKERFERPLWLEEMPGGAGGERVLVVCEQGGKVFGLPPAGGAKRLLWDGSAKVVAPGNPRPGENEEGLLGLAFHPKFKDNRLAYLHYSAGAGGKGGKRHNVLAAISVRADGSFDPASEKVLFTQDQPEWNHNGGQIAFGPDGFLYVGLGDGGAGGDPHGPRGNGQDMTTCLGKILRLDVDREDKARNTAYAIPKDNPFATREWAAKGARPEIWALGLRNPWRFSFDPKDKLLWCGDVGQNLWEEIDIIGRGGNYGWRVREGKHDFRGSEKPVTGRLVDPVHEYPRDEGKSVTGGFVYRGPGLPRWQGRYFFGDFVSGKVWALEFDGRETRRVDEVANIPGLSSFGVDAEGRLYGLSFADHTVYRFDGK